jgi:enoyl-CoA hydratase/carnithine racemase
LGVSIAHAGPVARLTLDFPAPGIMSAVDWTDIRRAAQEASSRPDARVVVIAGPPGQFIAGADIKHIGALDPLGFRDFCANGLETVKALVALELPVIAQIDGYALGAGVGLVMACDFAVASETTVFQLPEIKLGTFGGMGLFPTSVPRRRAARIVMLGERFDAATAQEIGFVDEVVAAADLTSAVDRLVASITAKERVSLTLAKRSFNNSIWPASAWQAAERHFDLCALSVTTDAWHAGVAKFGVSR